MSVGHHPFFASPNHPSGLESSNMMDGTLGENCVGMDLKLGKEKNSRIKN